MQWSQNDQILRVQANHPFQNKLHSPLNAHEVATLGNVVSLTETYLKLYQTFMIEIKLLGKQPC